LPKLKIGEFLRVEVGPGVAETLVRVSDWLKRMEGNKIDHERSRIRADVVERVAEDLITKARGIDRSLLSKSLQEAIYYAIRFDPNVDYEQLNFRLSRYLRRWGTRSFIKRFLSLFFFNFIRFHTGESFRELAPTSADLETCLAQIDLACQRTVASVWRSFEKTKRPLDLRAAEKLVREIDHRLRGI
jgi:hypothetical protein